MQGSEETGIRTKCVKARDFEPPDAFRIRGRPFIDQQGDFVMLEHVQSEPERNQAQRFLEAVTMNPKIGNCEVAHIAGISLKRVKEFGRSIGWEKRKVWRQLNSLN